MVDRGVTQAGPAGQLAMSHSGQSNVVPQYVRITHPHEYPHFVLLAAPNSGELIPQPLGQVITDKIPQMSRVLSDILHVSRAGHLDLAVT